MENIPHTGNKGNIGKIGNIGNIEKIGKTWSIGEKGFGGKREHMKFLDFFATCLRVHDTYRLFSNIWTLN